MKGRQTMQITTKAYVDLGEQISTLKTLRKRQASLGPSNPFVGKRSEVAARLPGGKNTFSTEPMGEKRTTALSGIGPVTARRLAEKGFDTAWSIFGQFLVVKKDTELFQKWMFEEFGINRKTSYKIWYDLYEWSVEFL